MTRYTAAPWFEVAFDPAIPPACTASLAAGRGWDGSPMTWTAMPGESSDGIRSRIAADIKAARVTGAIVKVTEHPAWWAWRGHVPTHLKAATAPAPDPMKRRMKATVDG